MTCWEKTKCWYVLLPLERVLEWGGVRRWTRVGQDRVDDGSNRGCSGECRRAIGATCKPGRCLWYNLSETWDAPTQVRLALADPRNARPGFRRCWLWRSREKNVYIATARLCEGRTRRARRGGGSSADARGAWDATLDSDCSRWRTRTAGQSEADRFLCIACLLLRLPRLDW